MASRAFRGFVPFFDRVLVQKIEPVSKTARTTVPSVEDTGDESPGDSKEELSLDEEIMRLAESSEEDSSVAISNEDVDKPEARDSQEQQSNDFAQHPFDDQPDSETE